MNRKRCSEYDVGGMRLHYVVLLGIVSPRLASEPRKPLYVVQYLHNSFDNIQRRFKDY
jgi:hypothetical protein